MLKNDNRDTNSNKQKIKNSSNVNKKKLNYCLVSASMGQIGENFYRDIKVCAQESREKKIDIGAEEMV